MTMKNDGSTSPNSDNNMNRSTGQREGLILLMDGYPGRRPTSNISSLLMRYFNAVEYEPRSTAHHQVCDIMYDRKKVIAAIENQKKD